MVDPLAKALADPSVSADARQKLQHVQDVLHADPQAQLISLFFEGEEPRAAVAFGDFDEADLIVVVLHGIDTDLDAFPAWAEIAQDLCADTIRASLLRGGSPRIATVAWFGYDSGTHLSALATRHATVGAARLAGDLVGMRHRHPTARIAVLAYSYSSTLFGELVLLDGAGPVSMAFSIASAGMTHMAADAVAEGISTRAFSFYATEASTDATAPLGRLGAHPVDPRDIEGAIVYSSDGGPIPGSGGKQGEATDGHASRTEIDDRGVRHRGYFDRRAQAYLFAVERLGRLAARRPKP
ncbi:Alpha/beta hydrolase [Microbacterium azadirachtae]|uniref:Alpha/beta hydrolase n=1 Tax=Microbacterium azadirachtae TaxID=582680 RepID=A0A1I6J5N9_9MICO|nr:alpha/beta hydrolase [Microbacterium azadirachtae]SFR74315.1 Alpha/beta hydrolase [Microbacterium azadirachtae]